MGINLNDTNNLISMCLGAGKNKTPEIGMGATQICYTDRHAFTIIGISKTGKTITIQRDKAFRIDNNGMSDSQEYNYQKDDAGVIYKARQNKNGDWKILNLGNKIIIDKREEYFDYSF